MYKKTTHLAALCVAFLLVFPSALAAQSQPCPRRSEALTLAILTVHEAGWNAEADMRGIHAVIRAIASEHGTTYATAACIHSPRALRGETSRLWVSQLDERGSKPAAWPLVQTTCDRSGTCRVSPHATWFAFRARWLETLETARRVISEEPAAPCLPATWGSAEDVERREALSRSRTWVDVACGDTRNRYGYWSSASTRVDTQL